MVEITRIDGDAPGPALRVVPPALRTGMLARITKPHQVGTNGSAVLMYDVRVGHDPEGPTDPHPIYARLYGADLNPLPEVVVDTSSPALADARRRYANSDERSITAQELAAARKPLTFHATPEVVAQEKAKAERLKAEAEAARLRAIAKCKADAEAATRADQPRFADGTQNDRVPADIQKALAETGLK